MAGAGLIALSIVAISVALDRQNSQTYRTALHEDADRTAFFLQQRLSGQIKADQNTARNLARAFALNPDEAMHRFADEAQFVLATNPYFTRIDIAPAARLAYSFPQHPETGLAGLSLTERYAGEGRQMRHAEANLHKGRPSLIATQEGQLVLLTPVMINPLNQSTGTFWGTVEIIIAENHFFNAAGFTVMTPEIFHEIRDMRVAIRDISGRGNGIAPTYLFGDPEMAGETPVVRRVPFDGGALEVMVMPATGWDIPWAKAAAFRFALVLAGCAIIIPIFGASMLIAERNSNIVALQGREARLLELSQRYNLAMESSHIGIWEMQDGSDDIYWDERAAMLHGELPEEIVSPLEQWLMRVVPEDRDKVRAHFCDDKLTGCTYNTTYRIQTSDGSIRCLRSVGSRYESVGTSTRTTGIIWDVTSDEMLNQTLREAKELSDIKNAELELALQELSSREQELEDLSRKLDLALESYHCGIWEANLENGTEYWDARMCQLYGVPPERCIVTHKDWLDAIHPDDRVLARTNIAEFEPGARTKALVVRVIRPDGETRYIRSVGQMHVGRDGSRKIIGIAIDVTEDTLLTQALKSAKQEADVKNVELEAAKSRIEHNALHDPLTALGNRRKLDLELERLSQESAGKRVSFAILHLDLDRFKQINDTLGHAAGDAMLNHVARVLTSNVGHLTPEPAANLVARIGGDEFVILLPGTDSRTALTALANRIVQEIRQPVEIDGFSCRCGVSIGIAQGSGTDVDARRVLINADIALYRAKRMGRNRYEFFTQNLQAEIINAKRMADEILAGIDNNEFTAWYQPQFCAKTMQLTGVEALVRWHHPTHGLITPDRFLSIAEELNVVATLDRMVMQTALKDRMRWAAMGINVPKVSVNVSLRRLHDEALIETLKGLSITPGELCFELVESIFLDDREAITDINLEQIKALGIDIEIDDFGTGHTSIVSLLKLKPKRLKIDRQLVMPILASTRERALVRSIIDIARSLGVETVAEGVETLDHARMLADLGCDMLQGYAFAKPLSFEDFAQRTIETGWKFAV
ncbi:bifunctional diguanylate cyclase/phosphodiesterase [Ectorhizobium quercum]|uniref:bifunctional diguanylate cyclase/phosphodiesterase n=1 Tax=Ectorhizobium quercum TaxID=2965071 RepID=UPI002795D5A7|nr:EAL domain-containing protein [Ectorhizobium quercum]